MIVGGPVVSLLTVGVAPKEGAGVGLTVSIDGLGVGGGVSSSSVGGGDGTGVTGEGVTIGSSGEGLGGSVLHSSKKLQLPSSYDPLPKF
jgi:hypothetical protein